MIDNYPYKTVGILSKFLVIARELFRKFCCAGAERIWPPSGARAERGLMERGGA